MVNREVCGGDASADFDRAQFGLTKAVEGDSTVRLMNSSGGLPRRLAAADAADAGRYGNTGIGPASRASR